MKKNYAKILVAAALVAVSALSINAEKVVVLSENFDKLENAVDANGLNRYSRNPWTGADANGVSYQPNFADLTAAGLADDFNGWTSRTTCLYPCRGFARISKTNYGGDLLSPKFTALTAATDLTLKWQGIGYTSNVTLNDDGSYKSGGVHDYQYYCVAVLGDGEIEGATKTMQVTYQDEDANTIGVTAAVIEIPTEAFITMDTLAAWNVESTWNTLKIKGATANTQVVFMSTIPNFTANTTKVKTTDYTTADMPIATDAPHGTNVKVNRVILDNIEVSYEKSEGGVKGDVNGDGTVNTSDVTSLINLILGA